jgi:hypothetical protein
MDASLNLFFFDRFRAPCFFLSRLCFVAALVCSFVGSHADLCEAQEEAKTDASQWRAKVDFFESKIRPILIEHCYECHASATGDNGGDLRLDSAQGVQKGGSRGAAIKSESPTDSLLLKAIRYEVDDLKMPPKGKLPQASIELIQQWISDGAADPRVQPDSSTPEGNKERAVAQHWAFQPLPSRVEKSIDALLEDTRPATLTQLNPKASPRALIRRLYYDLLGLMPTWQEYNDLESQPVDNYSLWVDTLLSSPHFGERMARRWMDVARYADNKGYVFQEDREYTHAWRYRQWLIDAFNTDMPFDAFASYQIAADRMDAGSDNKNLDAMGFLTLGRRFLNNENDIADDRIDVVTRGLLGITVACARCHDHKFDAIGMDDYYSLHAAFVSSKEPKDEPGPLRLVDSENIRPAVIMKRGNAREKGAEVPKRFVKFLSSVSRPLELGSGRMDIARAIVDPKNPLTARVYVNRIWGWIMGTPLVSTPSDFGMRSEAPAQLALLDQLAAEFVADGQSTKRLIRRIVMSDAYRRSSEYNAQAFSIDPENKHWWRADRKRMDFESMRDAVLVACQTLDRKQGGASVKITDVPFSSRRTLYAYIDRQNLPGVFRSFDFASPDAHVPNRFSTTVPQQGLFFLNSPMIDHYAAGYAKRIMESLQEQKSESLEQTKLRIAESIRELFCHCLLRFPTDGELSRSKDFLGVSESLTTNPTELPWTDLIKCLICSNEFCFVD